MLNKEELRNYVRLYRDILIKYNIVVSNEDISNIYALMVLTFELDDLYDAVDSFPKKDELDKIKQEMTFLMPNNHPIALNAVELVFKSMDEEANLDLSHSLTEYLSVCGKSIGTQLVVGYLASKKILDGSVWFSNTIVKFNDEIGDIIRLANDYLDVTADASRIFEEVPQIKASIFFCCKFGFKSYLYYRYVLHEIRYCLYLIGFKYLNVSSLWQDYLYAINCAESVLKLAVKAYFYDKKSCRELES